MKKRCFCLILALVMVLQLFAITASAETSSISFTLGAANGQAGDTVSLSLSMDSTVAANSYSIAYFEYNKDALQFVGFDNIGDIIWDSIIEDEGVDNENVSIVFAYKRTKKLSGDICNVNFVIKDTAEPGDYSVTYVANAVIVTDGEEDINVENIQINSGSVHVEVGHVHAYQAVITPPTCTEEGFTTYTCDCGDSYVADKVAALGHDLKETVAEPTCTSAGSRTMACSRCDYKEESPIDALGHDYKAEVTAPTCIKNGYTTYTCANCGETYIDNVVSALGHDLKETVVESTCTTAGSTTKACSRCDYKEVTPIAALGHEYKPEVTEPTCVEDGYTTFICSHCGDRYVSERVKAMDHDYASVVTKPTCTEDGYTTYTCTRCGNSYTDDVVSALGHDLKETVVEPTCTTAGSTTKACTCCDYKEVTPIDALGHDYEAEVTAPTCTEAGYTTHTCTRCDVSYTDNVVSAQGHDLHETIVEATCTMPGSTTKACSRCDYKEVTPIDALGHDYKAVVTAPTCMEDGYTTYTCSKCHDTYTDNVITALGHDLKVADKVEPSCTSAGSVTQVCSCCDYQTVTPVSPLGHDYQAEITAPTCTEDGFTTYTCSLCGDTYTDNAVSALGHSYDTVAYWNWVLGENGYTATAICRCAVCNEAEISLPATVATSSENEGYITYKASVMLGETECSTIKMDKVSYSLNVSSGIITSGKREDGEYSYSDLIAVQADAAAQGMFFDGWYLNGEKVSSNIIYKFNIKSDTVLEAQYNEKPVEAKPLVTLEITDRVPQKNGKQQLKLIVRWELPLGYQPVKAGLVRGYNIDDPAVLSLDNVRGSEIKDSSVAAVVNTGSYTLNLSLSAASAEKDLSAVGYLECVNAAGEHMIVYTDPLVSAAK